MDILTKHITINNRNANFDFVKGVAITFVVIQHFLMRYVYLPPHTVFTIQNAVPLFIVVTVLLRYNKLQACSKQKYYYSVRRELGNVFSPFIIAEVILLCMLPFDPMYFTKLIGMGSYYPFVYAQVIIFAPIAFILLNKNFIKGSLIILFFCVATEVLFSIISLPSWIYRFLFTRYCFLYVIAYILLNKQLLIKYKWEITVLTVICSIYIYFQCFQNQLLFFYHDWIGNKFPRDFVSMLWFVVIYELCNYLPDYLIYIYIYI